MRAVQKALAAFLRAFADGIDNGDFDISDATASRLLDVCSEYERKDGAVTNERLLGSLGKAYALLSKRQDRLEAAIQERRENIVSALKESKVFNVDFTKVK